MSVPPLPDLDALSLDELKKLVVQLLVRVSALEEEILQLRAETARLKDLPKKPKLAPGGMDKATEPDKRARTKEARRQRRKRQSGRRTPPVTTERTLVIEAPEGPRRRGFEPFPVQDLILAPQVIRFRRERWVTPSGQEIIAPLPPEVSGHFGPGIVRYIPRLREMSKKPLARAGMRDSSGSYDSRRLSDLRGTAGPDRAGSGWDSRASSGPACERAGAAGPWDELRGCWSGAADRRRYDPDVAPSFRGRRGRWPGRIQLRGSRLPVDPGVAGNAEDLGRRHLAADDPDGRSVDRTRVRGCLREPFRADCAAASSGTGTSQARGGVAQARPGQTAGLHRRLRDAAEDAARRRGGD